MTSSDLDDRYGRTLRNTRLTRWSAILLGACVVLASVMWVVWAGIGSEKSGPEALDVGYTVVSEHETVIVTQVAMDPGREARCALKVLDSTSDIVGWREIEVPATDRTSQTLNTHVKTTVRGVTGVVNDCWYDE